MDKAAGSHLRWSYS